MRGMSVSAAMILRGQLMLCVTFAATCLWCISFLRKKNGIGDEMETETC